MPYSYTLTSVIRATPEEIYEAWLDSLAHSEMTGGAASMSDAVGADVSAWGGYISGRNLELVPGERIVQSWRTSKFGDEHEDSVITITLAEAGDGTLLTLLHSNVPDEHRSYEEGGWESNYFQPMRVYFAKLAEESAEEEEGAQPEPATSTTELPPARPRKRTTAKTVAKPKKAAKAKRAKKAAPRKAAPAKKIPKRAAAPKAKRKSAVRPAKKRKIATRAARKSVRRQGGRR